MLTRTWLLAILLLLALCVANTHAQTRTETHEEDDHDHDHDEDEDHDHDHEHEHEGGSSVKAIKGAAIGVTFGCSMLINTIVILLAPRMPALGLKLLSAFSGGVMLVTGMCHILGESTAIFEAQFTGDLERLRPSFILAVAGCLFMLFLQRAITEHGHSHGLGDDDDEHGHSHGHQDEDHSKHDNVMSSNPIVATAVEEDVKGVASPNTPDAVVVVNTDATPAVTTVKASENETADKEANANVSSVLLSRVMLLVMFIFHSLIEGMALGLQQTKQGAIVIFVAIIIHHWAEDLTFSLSTIRGGALPRWMRFALCLVEASSCPIGIGIGWGIGAKVSSVVTAYLLALSAGTFLMLSLVEIVGEVLPVGKRSSLAFLLYFLGAGLMYMLLVLVYDSEAHNH
ncbi:membrane-associated protein, putative [Bodo saltans]|uniref:Membrane-associated protein, putative n=1 Tax=Bodo saltans TaxID=75058 RepID=A0A0S4JAK5_BODSA|nr:membrane-associated protein, putative [Bodo saltans]|eukprot:CUG82413.1 membrane-associated protein, putative [Bodo saltans]